MTWERSSHSRRFPITTRDDFRVTIAAGGGMGCPTRNPHLATAAALPRPRRRHPERLVARARPASGASSGGSPPVACASACASSQSASHGFRGSSGPWRYVPMRPSEPAALEPRRAVVPEPVHDAAERLGAGIEDRLPCVVLEAGELPFRPGSSSHSSRTSPIMRTSPGDGLVGEQPGSRHERPVAATVAAARGAGSRRRPRACATPRACAARIASPFAARSGAMSPCSRSWPPPT